MAPKKQKVKKSKKSKPAAVQDNADQKLVDAGQETQPEITQSETTTTETKKKRYGGARGPSSMYKVVVKKAQGKKFKVRCNYIGVPVGRVRHTLQSYIGMLARTMIPIDIKSWPFVERELKNKLWMDIQVKSNKIIKLHSPIDLYIVVNCLVNEFSCVIYIFSTVDLYIVVNCFRMLLKFLRNVSRLF